MKWKVNANFYFQLPFKNIFIGVLKATLKSLYYKRRMKRNTHTENVSMP